MKARNSSHTITGTKRNTPFHLRCLISFIRFSIENQGHATSNANRNVLIMLIVEFPLSLLLSFLVKQKCVLATVNDIHSSFKTLKSKLRRMFICTYMHLKGEQFMGKIG